MMDKKPHIKPYLYGMFAGFGAISLSILFFFLIYRFQGFGNAVSTLTGILMPFIYGSVIAYLLKPVCNWLEAFLHKLFPEKMHRFANMLAVALTILFGLLLIYALIMMIVPQLINSVTALYYTARDNIGDFVEWISKQEFIANNKKLLDFIETQGWQAIQMSEGLTWADMTGTGTGSRTPGAAYGTGIKPPKRPSSPRRWVCPDCGTIIRSTKEVNVICGDCGKQFIRTD